jgi:hypothetical protein
MGYVQRNLIGLDQLLNTMTGGYPDETLSARCGRLIHRSPYKYWAVLIDAIFYPFQGPNHCVNAYQKEKERYQFPKEYRE